MKVLSGFLKEPVGVKEYIINTLRKKNPKKTQCNGRMERRTFGPCWVTGE